MVLNVFVLLLIPFVTSDTNVFIPSMSYGPAHPERHRATIQTVCSDDSCGNMTLDLSLRGNSHKLSLVKRFELQLEGEEVCDYYTNADPIIFSSIRYCRTGNSSRKLLYGTLFDKDWGRFDFRATAGDPEAYDVTYSIVTDFRVLKKDVFNSSVRSIAERDRVRHLEITNRTGNVPIISIHPKPVIELMIGIDDSFAYFFNHDVNSIIMFVCMCVNSADAMWRRQMGISVKLVGIRFWKELGFTAESQTFAGHRQELDRFFYGSRIVSGVMDYNAGQGPDRIPGTPDAIMTMTHRHSNGRILGLAEQGRNPEWGSNGIMIPAFASELTKGDSGSHRLHHYISSVILAHEIGHQMFLNHSETTAVSECVTKNGICIMSSLRNWDLPLWIKSDVQFIQENLKGLHRFLFQKNCRHADVGTVHAVNRVTTKVRVLMWFLLIAFVAADAFIIVSLRKWLKPPVEDDESDG